MRRRCKIYGCLNIPSNHKYGPLEYTWKRMKFPNSKSSELCLQQGVINLIHPCILPHAWTIMLGASPFLYILSATITFTPATSRTLINTEVSDWLMCNVNISIFILPDHLSLQTSPLAFLLKMVSTLFTYLPENFHSLNFIQKFNEICLSVLVLVLLNVVTQLKLSLPFLICEDPASWNPFHILVLLNIAHMALFSDLFSIKFNFFFFFS